MTKKPATIGSAQSSLERIAATLTEKGYVNPAASLTVRSSGERFSLFVHGYFEDNYSSDGKGNHCYGDTVEETIKAAFAYVERAEDRKDAKTSAFRKKLADLLDDAKSLGVEVAEVEAIVNPLTEMMAALSENIIEHQPIAAE